MANYRCEISIVQRSQGQSAVASAAYASRSKIKDDRTGKMYDYRDRYDKIYDEIILPTHAPEKYKNRAELWNRVERFEKNKDAQLARTVGLDLPLELDREQQIDLVREYVQENFVKRGMIADVSIHDNAGKLPRNPHAHIILTMRELDGDGQFKNKGKKVYILDENGEKIKLKNGRFKSRKDSINDWDKKETLLLWRESWANIQNQHLEKYEHVERVSHLSYEERGIDKIPTQKMGPKATAMERRYHQTGLCERPRIAVENDIIKDINKSKELLIALEAYNRQEISKIEANYTHQLNCINQQIIEAKKRESAVPEYKNEFNDYVRLYVRERKIRDKAALNKRERSLQYQIVKKVTNKNTLDYSQ